MAVVWTVQAKRDVDAIYREIAHDAPMAAARFTARLVAAGDSLERQPERGRAVGKSRELLSVRPYVIRYRVTQDGVVILAVRHGARRDGI